MSQVKGGGGYKKRKTYRQRSGAKGSRSNRDLFSNKGKYPPRKPYSKSLGGASRYRSPKKKDNSPSNVSGVRG